MGSDEFIEICKEEVRKHNEQHMDNKQEYLEYHVQQRNKIQKHKNQISESNKGAMLYESKYNEEKKELYIDAYKKFENKCIKIGE